MGFFDAFKDTLQLAKNTFVVIGKNPAILKPTMKQVWIGAIVYFLVIASIFAIAFPYNVLPIIAAIVIFGCIIYLVFIFPFVKIHYKAAQCWMVYRTFAGKPVTYEEGLQRAKINKKDIILLGVFDILLRALANKLKQGTRKDGLWIILDIIMKIAGKVVEEGWDLIGHYLLPASIIKEQSVMEALPEKQVTMLYCEMEPKQREFYEYWREKFREEIKDTIRTQGFMQSRMKILAGLTKLRQICNHPLLVDESFTGESGKLNLLFENIDSVISKGHKCLIFSSFVKTLRIFRDYFAKNNIKFSYLDGSTANRKKVVETFQNDNSIKVFLISLKAGGLGLNLTAADYVFVVDPWWNPAAEMQAIDRTHRIGQEKKVFVYKAITKDSVEEKILEMQQKKLDLVKNIITVEDGIFKALDREDILALFGQ